MKSIVAPAVLKENRVEKVSTRIDISLRYNKDYSRNSPDEIFLQPEEYEELLEEAKEFTKLPIKRLKMYRGIPINVNGLKGMVYIGWRTKRTWI